MFTPEKQFLASTVTQPWRNKKKKKLFENHLVESQEIVMLWEI